MLGKDVTLGCSEGRADKKGKPVGTALGTLVGLCDTVGIVETLGVEDGDRLRNMDGFE
jgi:hypothetical protein|tara:strand:+ start:256 stop:429 length:174 start_codon:yes stop_codon:yes gene_type:complete